MANAIALMAFATSYAMQKNTRNKNLALQIRAKTIREQQRSRLDGRHKYLLSLVADRVGLEEAAVEDFMLDGDQVTAVLVWVCARVMLSCVGGGSRTVFSLLSAGFVR